MHISQLPSGNWRVILQVNGVRMSATAPSKAAARRLGAEMTLRSGATPDERPDVREVIDVHLAAAKDRLSPTLYADYLSVYRRLPEPFLNRIANEVRPYVIDGLYAELTDNGLSAHRIRRIHELLSQAFRRAMRYEWVVANPVEKAEKPEVKKADVHPPPPADVARLVDAAPADLQLFLRLAASTGARRGELVALQWADVRFDTAELVIRRSLSYTPASGVVVGDTKTGAKGHRSLALGLPTMAALRAHRASMAETALAHGLPSPVWVFSHDAGVTPWRPDYATHAFADLRKKLKLTGVRLHDLRHFVATQMLAAGDSPVQVAGRLGHSTPTVTLEVYADWLPSHDRDAAHRLEGLLAPG
jgi:integrase